LSDFDIDNDQVRVYVSTTTGYEIYSSESSTGYIQNPNIYATSKSEIEGWNCSRSAANGYTKATGDTYFEVWSATAAGQQFDYYQDISNLPSGVYELSAVVFNSTDNVSDAKVNGSVVLYAQADTIQYFAQVTKDSEIDYENRLTVPGIVVMNGKMRVGVKNIGEMGARWAGADDFKLIRTGDLESDSHAQYKATLSEQNTKALEAFCLPSTDEEGTLIRDASAFVVNPSCQRSDTYGWTVSNNGTNTGEASDGVSSNAYWNMWKGSAFTSTMSQDITYLPEGKYSANALLRGSQGAEISITAAVISPKTDEENSATMDIEPTGNTGGIGSKGWILAETPYVIIRPGDTLRINMQANISGGSGWWSADDFGLTWQYVEPLADGIEEVKTITNPNSHESVIYDLSGRRVSKATRGIYIINGKKVVR